MMVIDISGAVVREGSRVAFTPPAEPGQAVGQIYGLVTDVSQLLAPEADAPAGAIRVTMRFEIKYYIPSNGSVPVPGTLVLAPRAEDSNLEKKPGLGIVERTQ